MIGIISFNIVFAYSYYLDQFQSRSIESSNQDTSSMLLSVIDDEDER